MRYLILFILSALVASAYMTPPDKVVIEGRIALTGTRPLATFPWRGVHPRLSEYPYEGVSDSREIEALWEIKDGKIYLLAASAYQLDEHASNRSLGLRELMPERIQDGKVWADWFTGDFDVIEIERVVRGLAPLPSNAPPMHVVKRKFRVEKGRVKEEPNQTLEPTAGLAPSRGTP